jgi:hypothetical protein
MKLVWEVIKGGVSNLPNWGSPGGGILFRAKVPGGWFVCLHGSQSSFFYPDREHTWDGNSLP